MSNYLFLFFFLCTVFDVFCSDNCALFDGSFYPVLLIDKMPLRFFYHSFITGERKIIRESQDIYDIGVALRQKIIFPQNVYLNTGHYLIDSNNKLQQGSLDIDYQMSGNAQIFTFGGDYFFGDSNYYFSVYAPLVWSNNKMKIRFAEYTDSFSPETHFFKKSDIHESAQTFSLSNIEIMFGSDPVQSEKFKFGYYLYLTTPNIPGAALSFEYKPFFNDYESYVCHFETCVAFTPYYESLSSYTKNSSIYYLSQFNGNGWYSESMINFLYQFHNNVFNLGYSFIAQAQELSQQLIEPNNQDFNEKTALFPRKNSSQWLSIVYGGYTYSTEPFIITLNGSYNSTFKDHYTPAFYDIVLNLGYNF